MSDEIKLEYLEPFPYTPTEAELLGQMLIHGYAIWPTRFMTREEIAEIYGEEVAPIRDRTYTEE